MLADRGFDISDDLASLAFPPFTKGKPQLSQREVEFSRQLSSIRIHVERAIGRIKNYKILKTTLPITLIKRDHETEFATIDKIVFICAALCNLYPPLVTSFNDNCYCMYCSYIIRIKILLFYRQNKTKYPLGHACYLHIGNGTTYTYTYDYNTLWGTLVTYTLVMEPLILTLTIITCYHASSTAFLACAIDVFFVTVTFYS